MAKKRLVVLGGGFAGLDVVRSVARSKAAREAWDTLLIERDDRSGPWNAVAPQAVPQAEFARTLGRVLRRPAVLPFPAFAARFLLGGLADLLLEGQRVEPARLLSSGFTFRHPTLEAALQAAIRRSGGC